MKNQKAQAGQAVPLNSLVRRNSKRLAATIVSVMIDHWICDGCPTGNDSDDYDFETMRGEAIRLRNTIDRRVVSLSPNKGVTVAPDAAGGA